MGDITKEADVQRLVDETVAHFGGVHILVNNAGAPRDKYLVKMSADDWDFVMNVMLKGAFLAARAVMPHFIEQGWGRLINISSRAHLGNPTQANYSAAKAGLIGMAKALSMEEGRYGITANCVAPGFMETEMVQALPTYETIKSARWRPSRSSASAARTTSPTQWRSSPASAPASSAAKCCTSRAVATADRTTADHGPWQPARDRRAMAAEHS